jgi:hypothetical protein
VIACFSLFQSIIAILMIMAGNIESLIDFFSFTAWIFYGGAMLALIVMRYTRPNFPRPYKVGIFNSKTKMKKYQPAQRQARTKPEQKSVT